MFTTEAMQDTKKEVAKRTFSPSANIYETDGEILLIADMPGADEKSVEITFEKDTITISGKNNFQIPEGYSTGYAEFRIGDYKRSFTVSRSVDQEKIEAVMKNGRLKIKIPKSTPSVKKVEIKAES